MLIVTSSGGSAIIATDVAADNGFRISPLPDALASQLREVLPPHFIVGNPLDLTGDGNAELFRHVIATARDHYDVVLTIFGDPIPGASQALEPGKPDLVAYLGGAGRGGTGRTAPPPPKGDRRLSDAGPCRSRPFPAMSASHAIGSLSTTEASASAAAPAAAPSGKSLSPADSLSFLAREGIRVAPSRQADNEEEAVAAALQIGYPVVVKMNSLET